MRSIPNIITNDKIVLLTIWINNRDMLNNENASIVNIKIQYIKTMVNRNLKYGKKPTDLIDTSPSDISSSRGMYSLRIYFRINASIVHARACIPCVSENISTVNPVKNDIVKTIFIFIVKGNLTMKYINTNGIATLNKQMLLHITT